MITLFINNEPKEFQEQLPLQQLVQMQDLVHANTFAVAVNQSFVPKTDYGNTMLTHGDRIEIVAPMQGG